jgi:c-di-GMP-binding flagellar brake protein YcgR
MWRRASRLAHRCAGAYNSRPAALAAAFFDHQPRGDGMAEDRGNLIPVRKNDIVLGQALPWAVYDANRVLLLNRGVVVTSELQREVLQEKGLYRLARLHAGTDRGAGFDARGDGDDGGLGAKSGEVQLAFDQIKLVPGDLMQLQPLLERQTDRYTVHVVGVMRPKSVLVTNPTVDGRLILVRDGQTFLVRAFSGLNVCAFKAGVLKSNLVPFPYLHLAYPDNVQAMRIRRDMRAPVNIIVAIYAREGGDQIAAGRMVDISVGGARVHSSDAFAQKGDRVHFAFKVRLDDMEEVITTAAHIRALSEEADENGKPVRIMGMQFDELSQGQRLIIMSLVYQSLYKDAF